MLKGLLWIVKIALFSLFILALGNWIHWGGRTISDQVKVNISQAERITGQAAENAKSWVSEKKRQAENAFDSATEKSVDAAEQIAPSERQKLRALIRELNGTQKKD